MILTYTTLACGGVEKSLADWGITTILDMKKFNAKARRREGAKKEKRVLRLCVSASLR